MASPKTAAQRVLAMPEVLEQVFTWISLDYRFSAPVNPPQISDSDAASQDSDDSDGSSDVETYGVSHVLAQCASVNQLWLQEVARITWKSPPLQWFWSTASELADKFKETAPSRRQFYADRICSLAFKALQEDQADEVNDALQDLLFPSLVELSLRLTWDTTFLPMIKAPSLKVLHLDPSFDFNPVTYRFYPEDWDKVLAQIIEMYPSLEEVSIDDYALVGDGALDNFVKQMPCLKQTSFEMALPSGRPEDPPW
jgi:hypothetical protein